MSETRETLYVLALWVGLWLVVGLGAVLLVIGYRVADDDIPAEWVR